MTTTTMNRARSYAAMSKDLRAFGQGSAALYADAAGVCALAGDSVGERANLEQAKAQVGLTVFAAFKAVAA